MHQLLNAINNNDLEAMNGILKEHNLDLNVTVWNDQTPLILPKSSEGMELLLHNGSYVEFKNPDCANVLIVASKNGHLDRLEIFIRHGANLNLKDTKNCTALHYSCIKE